MFDGEGWAGGRGGGRARKKSCRFINTLIYVVKLPLIRHRESKWNMQTVAERFPPTPFFFLYKYNYINYFPEEKESCLDASHRAFLDHATTQNAYLHVKEFNIRTIFEFSWEFRRFGLKCVWVQSDLAHLQKRYHIFLIFKNITDTACGVYVCVRTRTI